MRYHADFVIAYDVALMLEDMSAKGWLAKDLAAQANVSDRSVGRFIRGDVRTARMLAKLATALGHKTGRYVVRRSRVGRLSANAKTLEAAVEG